MGKSTISMAIFNSKLVNYQRVFLVKSPFGVSTSLYFFVRSHHANTQAPSHLRPSRRRWRRWWLEPWWSESGDFKDWLMEMWSRWLIGMPCHVCGQFALVENAGLLQTIWTWCLNRDLTSSNHPNSNVFFMFFHVIATKEKTKKHSVGDRNAIFVGQFSRIHSHIPLFPDGWWWIPS